MEVLLNLGQCSGSGTEFTNRNKSTWYRSILGLIGLMPLRIVSAFSGQLSFVNHDLEHRCQLTWCFVAFRSASFLTLYALFDASLPET